MLLIKRLALEACGKLRLTGNHNSEAEMKKQKLPIDITKIKPEDKIKYEMAKELGLYDQVINYGWGSLSAKQTGKIGGMIAGVKREQNAKKEE